MFAISVVSIHCVARGLCASFLYKCPHRAVVPSDRMTFLLTFVLSVLGKRLARKSISEMTYFMSSGMKNLNSINQSIVPVNFVLLFSRVQIINEM